MLSTIILLLDVLFYVLANFTILAQNTVSVLFHVKFEEITSLLSWKRVLISIETLKKLHRRFQQWVYVYLPNMFWTTFFFHTIMQICSILHHFVGEISLSEPEAYCVIQNKKKPGNTTNNLKNISLVLYKTPRGFSWVIKKSKTQASNNISTFCCWMQCTQAFINLVIYRNPLRFSKPM